MSEAALFAFLAGWLVLWIGLALVLTLRERRDRPVSPHAAKVSRRPKRQQDWGYIRGTDEEIAAEALRQAGMSSEARGNW